MATPSTSSAAAAAATATTMPPSSSSSALPAPPSGQRHPKRRRTRADALLDLPAFLFASAFLLYWSLPIAALLGRVRFWQLRGRRDDALGWAVTLQKLFSVRMFLLPGPSLLKDEACLYLANHRSWADFFLDVVATDGRAQMLSRAAVAAAFPAFMLAVCVIRSVILFRRDNVKDFNVFNEMIESRIRASPVDGLIVYPEGHRSTKSKPLPLKKGMLQFAWSRSMPVQVVASSGKEGVISEKATSARWGRRVAVAYSIPIRPSEHKDFEAFFSKVVEEWVATWNRVAKEEAAALKTASPMPELKLDNRRYPDWMLRAQVVVTGTTVLAFLATCFFSARFFVRRVASLPGFLQMPVVLILGLWCAVSVARARGEPPCPPINRIGAVDAREYAEEMAAEAAASKRRRSLKMSSSSSGNGGAANAAAASSAAASDLTDANGG